MRSALAPRGAADPDAAVVAEGVSKQYPRVPVTMWPAVVSMFDRGWFGRGKGGEDDAVPDAGFSPEGFDLGADDIDDEDDDEDDEEQIDERVPPPTGPGENFWALKDVSFLVPQGASLGVLGPAGSGKTTLMRILGGQCFPTEGSASVRDPVSPLPAELAKAMGGKGDSDPIMAARLLGVERHRLRPYAREIEELAGPRRNAVGQVDPGIRVRLAVATTVLLPSSVILLEEMKAMNDEFMDMIVHRLHQRRRTGTALVIASSKPEMIAELCEEAILLDEGRIVARGATADVLGSPQFAAIRSRTGKNVEPEPGVEPGGRRPRAVPGKKLRVPEVVTAFHGWAGLVSAGTMRESGTATKRFDAEDVLVVEVRLETTVPGVEALCSIEFTPREDGGPGVRVEQPETVRFDRPGEHHLAARIRAGLLGDGPHDVRVDAIVTHPDERRATVIARPVGKVRISSAGPPGEGVDGTQIRGWDGRDSWRGDAEWSIE